MSFWSATGLSVHRYKQEVTIPRAAVGIVGGIQPGTFRDEVKKERHITDGFCARFLLTWQSQQQPAKWTDKKISFDTGWELSEVFDKLLELPCEFEGEFYKPIAIPLNDGARLAFMRFYNRHNAESFRLDHDLKAAWKKLEAYTARFALIFQMVTWASKASSDKAGKRIEVSTVNMQRAINLTEWFKSEAKRIYALLNETSDDTRRRELVDLIRRNGNKITANKLRQRNKAYGSEQSATSALNDLVKHRLATKELIKPGAKGGRPTTQYKIK